MMRELIANPIVRAGALCAALFGVAFYLFAPQSINDVLDAFAIAGATLTLWRFGPHVFAALRKRDPDSADVMIVALAGMVAAIGFLRVLREFALDLGVITTRVVGVLFGAATVLMVFCIFLLLIAPPVRRGTLRLSPFMALILAVVCGSSLAVLIMLARYSRYWWS